MIVTDENVETALAYLALDPHPLAVAEFELTRTKNAREALFAQIFTEVTGSIKERECRVALNWDYQMTRELETSHVKALANEKAKRLWAETVTALYQTVSANARYMERIR